MDAYVTICCNICNIKKGDQTMKKLTKEEQRRINMLPPISIEYDWGNSGQRRKMDFDNSRKANQFFLAKEKAGKKPKLLTGMDMAAQGAGKRHKTKKMEPLTPPGVKLMKTRPYLAGAIIAKHGLAAGVTDAMIAELDEAYGKPNPIESRFCLKNAHHAARGYLGIAEDAIEQA